MTQPIIWVHGDCLSPLNPALAAYPGAPALYVWDEALLADYGLTLKRVVFMYECLLELPVTIRRGKVAEQLILFAVEHGAGRIVTVGSPSPRFKAICSVLRPHLPIEILDEEPFLDYDGQLDLKRFSRYWAVAQKHLAE